MSTAKKSGASGGSDGCWTCKLRRKKCDERRPACGICDHLGIACTYGPKPTWMHSRRQQRHMAEKLKQHVKQRAAHRRESANTSTHHAAIHGFNVIPDMVSNDLWSFGRMNDATSASQTATLDDDLSASHGSAPSPLLSNGHERGGCLTGLETSSALETDFIMKYFDFAFPTFFPFYRPGVFETGRSWLLLLLGKSKIAYHSTVSFSYYFFTMALTDASIGEEHAECKQVRWKEIEQHATKCFDGIRAEMLALEPKSQGAPASNMQKMEILGGVIQVLIFESALGKCAPCNPHLTAAFTLLEGIIACSSQSAKEQGHSKIMAAVLEAGQPSWTMPGNSIHIWSPQQAGFRFCAGLLVFMDVVASTALQEAPRLLRHHPDILAEIDDGALVFSDAKIRLSSIVGCRNWVIHSIAKTSALALWKNQQNQAKSLSMIGLVDRASSIANDLTTGIVGLQSRPTSTSSSSDRSTAFTLQPKSSASITSTLIWAHAAQLYLSDVVSGWQLSNTEVRINVTNIIKLLQDVPIHQLRALAWPICVAGCLALESEESSFLTLLSGQSKVYTAGALDDTRQIWKQVWQTRATPGAGTWNLASCFSILGSPILLV
ncbi:hypothetical protein DM02DRAFT_619550 [Periconia macrospinosa]|uniref:Zn(2)-C6 fungal-type domain-containing protein n=1 Tax=Periconia macrospinosa TaxID=97972 RepID=A0A2V1D4Z6_9PLEO|nr:hypothetical protein DM02DRAFT_619550 [Periconia macrospinosa]